MFSTLVFLFFNMKQQTPRETATPKKTITPSRAPIITILFDFELGAADTDFMVVLALIGNTCVMELVVLVVSLCSAVVIVGRVEGNVFDGMSLPYWSTVEFVILKNALRAMGSVPLVL